MVKEWQDGQLVLNQPAGHIENHESAMEAVIRETLEESGWRVKPTGLLGLYSFTPHPDADTYHRLCFVCEAVACETNELDKDIVSSHWLSHAEIKTHALRSPLVMTCIEDYQNNPIIPLCFMSDQFLTPDSAPI